MRSFKLELAVGTFVLLGVLSLAWLSVRMARMELVGDGYYPLVANFSSISGLKKGANVEIAGVEVGRVDDIILDTKDFEAKVTMKINSSIPVQEDAIASIRTKGLIGDRYIKISPGASERLMKAGERIIQTEPAINIEELISQFIHGSVK
ncbi:MAG: outer membrane lipid asymmetry maintenance protein MlaD [Magnetococcales bacterium]|nr:outer membrane lipid asymmetry maintenance protein MlaD [Magnetococcales bacterium]NGZ26320.1 outer membrane lipid asymmetry maintenance protein MlaD [Magnetococcales bacterium]